jgi:hypothetical protein
VAQGRRGQDRLDCGAQAFVIDRPDKAAGESHCHLLEGHHLQTVTAVARRREAAFPHGETTVNDQGGSRRDSHCCPPFRGYFLLGRWIGADAAAVAAASLLWEFRNESRMNASGRGLGTTPINS